LDGVLEFSGKYNSLATHLVEMDTDLALDRQASGCGSGSGKMKTIRPDPDPQHWYPNKKKKRWYRFGNGKPKEYANVSINNPRKWKRNTQKD
jgi:hypothetical protein